jgi:cytochrome c553
MKNLICLASLLSSSLVWADPFVLNGDAAKGEPKFKQLCVACHGEKGNGEGPAGAALNPKPGNFTDPANSARLTDEWIYKMVKNGGAANGKSPMMVAWSAVLKDDEIRNVTAYVLKFKPAPVAPAAPNKADNKKSLKKKG